MNHLTLCKCGEVLIKSVNGTTKLRSKIVLFKKNKAYAVCKSCAAEISIPLSLDKAELIKAHNRNPKLLVYDKDL
jgi:hypothetical protein